MHWFREKASLIRSLAVYMDQEPIHRLLHYWTWIFILIWAYLGLDFKQLVLIKSHDVVKNIYESSSQIMLEMKQIILNEFLLSTLKYYSQFSDFVISQVHLFLSKMEEICNLPIFEQLKKHWNSLSSNKGFPDLFDNPQSMYVIAATILRLCLITL